MLATLCLKVCSTEVDALAGQVKAHIQGDEALPVEVNIKIANTTLEGWLNHIYGQKQVFYRTASIKAKDVIRGFVHHLAAQIMGQPVETLILVYAKLVFPPCQKTMPAAI